MPYIPDDARTRLYFLTNEFYGAKFTSGELNFLITRLLLEQKPSSYDDFNRLIGVVECVKLELYRRMVAPYEDRKMKENGDVYDY